MNLQEIVIGRTVRRAGLRGVTLRPAAAPEDFQLLLGERLGVSFFGVWASGFGFRVSDFGFRVSGVGLNLIFIQGVGFRVVTALIILKFENRSGFLS